MTELEQENSQEPDGLNQLILRLLPRKRERLMTINNLEKS